MTENHTDAARRRIILVDDEEALVWSLSNRIIKQRPEYAVESASDGDSALERFGLGPVDLLVTDICMQGMHGLELIMAARRLVPGLPVIVMTAFPTAETCKESELRGSIEYLEKPFEFERFLQSIDAMLQQNRAGSAAESSVQMLPDIVQLYALSRATGVLRVRHRTAAGEIWFERGQIIHASTPTAASVAAFYEIMLWRGGEFSMQLGVSGPEPSIRAGWTELIRESCRRIDERRRQIEASFGPVSPSGWIVTENPGARAELRHNSNSEPPTPYGGEAAPVSPGSDHLIVEMFFEDQSVLSKENTMDVKHSLNKLNNIDGFVGAAIVDSESGMLLGHEGGGPINLEVAGASNSEVVRAKRKAMRNLNIKDDIEDILISLSKQYHLIRPLRGKPSLFFYLVLDRNRANLAMARLTLADVEKDLSV